MSFPSDHASILLSTLDEKAKQCKRKENTTQDEHNRFQSCQISSSLLDCSIHVTKEGLMSDRGDSRTPSTLWQLHGH